MMFDFEYQYLNPLGMDVAFAFIYLWLFYALYVFTMSVYRAKLSGRLCGFSLLLLYPFVLMAALVDVLCQLTIATVFFLELPRTCWQRTTLTLWGRTFDMTYLYIEPLVTKRLQRYHGGNYGWRTIVAAYVCDKLLDPFDPDGNHC